MTAKQGEKERFLQTMIRQITDGSLSGGDRLPTESEMAAQYGIAKTNVHLGIKELERLGMVKIVPRHATYVEDISRRINLDGVNAIFHYTDGLPNRPTVEAMLELREMMALSVIRWMVRRPDRAHMVKLKALCGDLETAAGLGDHGQVYQALKEFLTLYYTEAGNDIFPLLLRSFRDTVEQAVRYVTLFAEPKGMAAVYRAILRHTEAGDISAAQQVWITWNDALTARFMSSVHFPEK